MIDGFAGDSHENGFRGLLPLLLALVAPQPRPFSDFLTRVNAAPDTARAAIVDSFRQCRPARFPSSRATRWRISFIPARVVRSEWPANEPVGAPAFTHDAAWRAQTFGIIHAPSSQTRGSITSSSSTAPTGFSIRAIRTPWRAALGRTPNCACPLGCRRRKSSCTPIFPTERFRIRHFSAPPSATRAASASTRRPAIQAATDRYPLILFHDGLEYITLARADRVLDYLIAHGRIHPVIAVFVPPVSRTSEYAGDLRGNSRLSSRRIAALR